MFLFFCIFAQRFSVKVHRFTQGSPNPLSYPCISLTNFKNTFAIAKLQRERSGYGPGLRIRVCVSPTRLGTIMMNPYKLAVYGGLL